jgi:prolipoprotein diacylglyceryl transferase
MIRAAIPSPSEGVLQLGPLPLRGYALMIILGVVAAVMISDRRLVAKGFAKGTAADVATWAVPFGIVGARIYHVATDPELYFKAGEHPIEALYIWRGGLGIWGGVLGGALGAYIAARRRGIPFDLLADAVAPGIAVAQAIGRWGNWFNQELYGRPTNVPWAVHITKDPVIPGITHYQPTFLYECLWDLGVAVLCIWAGKRFKLAHGRVFALYVAAYCVGRFWIEALRIDDANHFLGLRLNDWTAIIVFLSAVAFFLLRKPRLWGPTAEEAGNGEAVDGSNADEVPASSDAATDPDSVVAASGDAQADSADDADVGPAGAGQSASGAPTVEP